MPKGGKQRKRRQQRRARQRRGAGSVDAVDSNQPETEHYEAMVDEAMVEIASADVECMMRDQGYTLAEITRMREMARQYVSGQDRAQMVQALSENVKADHSELHTTLEDIQKPLGNDCHFWHEIDFKVYDLPGGVDGDVQKYRIDNPETRFTLRAPYNGELSKQCYEAMIVLFRNIISEYSDEDKNKLRKQLEQRINEDKMDCAPRAAALMELYPERFNEATLRVGGVGWRHGNGDVHWEYG